MNLLAMKLTFLINKEQMSLENQFLISALLFEIHNYTGAFILFNWICTRALKVFVIKFLLSFVFQVCCEILIGPVSWEKAFTVATAQVPNYVNNGVLIFIAAYQQMQTSMFPEIAFNQLL